jgi:hypothetical protein
LLQVPAGNVHGAGDPTLLPLVALAHVDEEGAVIEQVLGMLGVDLLDLGLDGVQQVSVRGHCFRLYSEYAGSP